MASSLPRTHFRCSLLPALLVAGLSLVAAAPAARADDAADVKASARAFGQAVNRGDAAAARAVVVPSDGSDKLVNGLAAMAAANDKFFEAMKARFKEDTSRPGGAASPGGGAAANTLRWVKSIDESEVKVDGNEATLQPPPITIETGRPGTTGPGAGGRPGAAGGQRTVPAQPIHLKKMDGTWKVELSKLPGIGEDPSRAARLFAAFAKAYDETAAEVKDGKYQTARDAHSAIGRKMFAAFGAASGGAPAGAAGGPATKPSR